MTPISPDSVWAVVLAAGTSSRLGQPKQLLDLGGEPILNHVLRAAAMSRLGGTVLVLGHQAEAIGAAVGDFGQIPVVNRDYAAGQSTSLRAGIAALPGTATGAVVLLGDQPLVTAGQIDQLIDRFVALGQADRFIQTRYGEVPAPPVLIGRHWFPEVETISGDQGARELMRSHPDRIEAVTSDDDRPLDIDTVDDYRALLGRVSEMRSTGGPGNPTS